jgi:hypothetical protein
MEENYENLENLQHKDIEGTYCSKMEAYRLFLIKIINNFAILTIYSNNFKNFNENFNVCSNIYSNQTFEF